jgi:molybdopterin-guanine dinucleotide biosynthesis protein A
MAELPELSQLDAIVLAGGDSKRMGADKATLAFGDTSLVGTAVAALQQIFRKVIVVTRNRALLPGLDADILEDESRLEGPLVGVTRGLSHSDAPWCFVAACDMPFLQVEVIQSMSGHLMDCDAVIPEYDGRLQTLHAFYQSGACLPIAEELLAQGTTSMRALASQCHVTKLSESDFSGISNARRSFKDLDTAEEYRDALGRPEQPPIS